MRNLKLWIPLLAFSISFAATYPGSIVLKDEANYIRQADAFANGNIHVEYVHPVTNQSTEIRPSNYPPGTSLLTAPFIYVGGWQASFWMPVIALLLAVFFTAKMLRFAGFHQGYSLLLLLFPPSLVMARVVSSDLISATVVALGWLLFWKGISKNNNSTNSFALLFFSGFVAGVSLLFRETNALLFAPLFLGALIRWDRHWIWLLIGGIFGSLIRLCVSYLVFGDPLFTKQHSGFSLGAIPGNIPIYVASLTILVPGGLIFAAAYRGKRAPEIIVTVFLFLFFYLAYNSGYDASGFLKGTVLGSRFFIPILPVFAFVTAESAPRLLKFIIQNRSLRRSLAVIAVVLVTFCTILSNLLFHEWANEHERIQQAIYQHVPKNSLVIINHQSTLKYISELQGYNSRVSFHEVTMDEVVQMEEAYIVFLQRSDSPYWINSAENENRFLDDIPAEPVFIEFYENYLDNYSLKIYRTSHTD